MLSYSAKLIHWETVRATPPSHSSGARDQRRIQEANHSALSEVYRIVNNGFRLTRGSRVSAKNEGSPPRYSLTSHECKIPGWSYKDCHTKGVIRDSHSINESYLDIQFVIKRALALRRNYI